MRQERQDVRRENEAQPIKCVVWDLDNTVWDGVILEDQNVTLKTGVVDVIKALDKRGILMSISSKNNFDVAATKLKELGLWEFFLYPQINWDSKSSALEKIAKSLNIALDTFAFVDDQAFERDEVKFNHPQVMCIDTVEVDQILNFERMNPRFVTSTSAIRRNLYQSEIQRKKSEEEFEGASDEFLESLGLEFEIKPADEEDLQRAEELTVRTHQLNSTGYTYSYDELNEFRHSDQHSLLVSSLKDKYGTYGIIGLSLVEKQEHHWVVKLLLMSCRVMSRGVGTIMLSHIMSSAREAGVKLRAEFLPTDVNRMMFITYKLGGFKQVDKKDELLLLEHNLEDIPSTPHYVDLTVKNA